MKYILFCNCSAYLLTCRLLLGCIPECICGCFALFSVFSFSSSWIFRFRCSSSLSFLSWSFAFRASLFPPPPPALSDVSTRIYARGVIAHVNSMLIFRSPEPSLNMVW